jgi:coiled-coil domain-containing protein 12
MESAAERKARLKALRQEAAAAEVSEPAVRPAAAAATQPAAPEPPTLKFRNYAPRDEKIEHDKIAPANPEQFAPLLAEDEEDDEEPAAVNGEVRSDAHQHIALPQGWFRCHAIRYVL